jgi:hypothetical protein
MPENYKYPSLRPVLTFLIFVVLGPAIGGVVFVVLSWIVSLASDIGQLEWLFHPPKAILHALVFVQLFAYFFGGLQALVVGALASIFHLRDRGGPVPLAPVLVGSVLCGLVFLAGLSRGEVPQVAGSAVLLLVHVGAGLCCWLIANALLRLIGSRRSATMPPNDQVGMT